MKPGCWDAALSRACFSDGRTFRLAVRLRQRAAAREEAQLGLLARCERCGDQAVQSLLKLSVGDPVPVRTARVVGR